MLLHVTSFCNTLFLVQTLFEYSSDSWHELELPGPNEPLERLPHLKWDSPARLFSPAFWRHQHWTEIDLKPTDRNRCKLGESLLEETVGCVLGGFGLAAESSMAYFSLMKTLGVFESPPSTMESVFQILRTPVVINGRPRRYRFWKSKGSYIYRILKNHTASIAAWEKSEKCPIRLRENLRELPGIGIKTASWISRNWLDSDKIAVIDIHILRSLAYLGYKIPATVTTNAYITAEQAFLGLAESLGVSAQTLDLVMWSRMRELIPKISPPKLAKSIDAVRFELIGT